MTADEARAAESRAVDHIRHGRPLEAHDAYREAALAWEAVCDRLSRHGETLISDMFRAEVRKCERKADALVWQLID